MANKYAEELERERMMINKSNPFSKKIGAGKGRSMINNYSKDSFNDSFKDSFHDDFHFNNQNKGSNYFTLILDSKYEDLELYIRGLEEKKILDKRTGKEKVAYKKDTEHFLSDEGAKDLLRELKGHLSPDIKLGNMSKDEFLQTQEIIRKSLLSFVYKNLYSLGMDTEKKQRKARPLCVMILNRIRATYSRSIEGAENKASHGDINLSGQLEFDREERFNLEDAKN